MSSDFIQKIRAQSHLSISIAISIIEDSIEAGNKLLSNLFKYTGHAYRIGITGPPGVGKSSLTDNLISAFRRENKSVAVVAVDPTSPFSGGSMLGDRIRMTAHHKDPKVFIRSMATRGRHGGLGLHPEEVGDIFDAAKFDIIIYETVGVGQIELDILKIADSIIVVLVPESGDEIQLMKAGLMEIGNIFTINKADRPGANKLKITIKNILSTITFEKDAWHPEVVQTIATENKGTNDLLTSIYSHQSYIQSHGIQKQKFSDRYERRINALINLEFQKNFWNDAKSTILRNELKKEQKNQLSPYKLAEKLLNI